MNEKCFLLNWPVWLRIIAALVFIAPLATLIFALLNNFPCEIECNPITAGGFRLVIVYICGFLIYASIRMAFGLSTLPNGLSPITLCVLGLFFLFMPLAGIRSGYYEEHGIFAYLKALGYIMIALYLFSLARSRSVQRAESNA